MFVVCEICWLSPVVGFIMSLKQTRKKIGSDIVPRGNKFPNVSCLCDVFILILRHDFLGVYFSICLRAFWQYRMLLPVLTHSLPQLKKRTIGTFRCTTARFEQTLGHMRPHCGTPAPCPEQKTVDDTALADLIHPSAFARRRARTESGLEIIN